MKDFFRGGGGRKSNFELLRLFSITGIVIMHTFGPFYDSISGSNLFFCVFVNSIFNMGVSLFVLISGYFGMKPSGRKMFLLWSEVLFYSIAGIAIAYIWNIQTFNIKDILKACMPISSNKYWYITCYLLLMAFSGYINRISEALNKKEFEKLIAIMGIIFSVLPTITQLHIMKDSGKGPFNMLLIYLIGRYISKYVSVERIHKRKVISIIIIILLSEFSLNYLCSFVKNKGIGIYYPFALDYSIFIILGSVFVFLLFATLNFTSVIINTVSKHVLGVYLFEEIVRAVLNQYFDLTQYKECWYLPGIILVWVFFIIFICMAVDIVRNYTFGKISVFIFSKVAEKKQVAMTILKIYRKK